MKINSNYWDVISPGENHSAISFFASSGVSLAWMRLYIGLVSTLAKNGVSMLKSPRIVHNAALAGIVSPTIFLTISIALTHCTTIVTTGPRVI